MVWLIISLVILLLIIIGLTVKILLMRKSALEIIDHMSTIHNNQTNVVVDISSKDKKIRKLTSRINAELVDLQKLKVNCANGDREIKESIANISHDLRTPLTAIIGYINFLDEEEKSEKATEYVEIIKERANTLRILTEELFKYSIIVSHKDYNDLDVVNINCTLQESILGCYGMFKDKCIEPIISITNKPIDKTISKRALTSILDNIISNAIKYSDGDFEVVLNDDGEMIFSNTSKSLSTISIEQLFDRYFTIGTYDKSTGLGLAIAKTLVEDMDGTIKADYKNGKFTVVLKI